MEDGKLKRFLFECLEKYKNATIMAYDSNDLESVSTCKQIIKVIEEIISICETRGRF